MHHPKHIYLTGLSTGIFSGILSSLTVWESIKHISNNLEGGGNPVIRVAILSILVGAALGLIISFLVHRFCANKKLN